MRNWHEHLPFSKKRGKYREKQGKQQGEIRNKAVGTERMELEEDDINYFSKYQPKAHSFPSRKALYILLIFLCLILIYLIWSYQNWKIISLSKVYTPFIKVMNLQLLIGIK